MTIDIAQAYSFLNQGGTQPRPLVGISACLCGEKVRYDGQDKGQPELTEALAQQLELLKVCPEVAIGMGVPRPPIQLVQAFTKIEARGVENPQQNFTLPLQDYAQSIIESYTRQPSEQALICGFILKSRSPSCGVGSTPIHKNHQPIGFGNGIFSQQLQKQLPWLPLVEDEGLQDPKQRQTFILHSQLVKLFWQTCSQQNLMNFHQLAHDLISLLPATSRSILDELSRSSQLQQYLTSLMKALKQLT